MCGPINHSYCDTGYVHISSISETCYVHPCHIIMIMNALLSSNAVLLLVGSIMVQPVYEDRSCHECWCVPIADTVFPRNLAAPRNPVALEILPHVSAYSSQ